MKLSRAAICLAAFGILGSSMAFADTLFNGVLFYTNFTGGNNVNKVSYTYDQTTMTLTMGAATNIAATPGADGIIFDPAGNLLVGGQGANQVYEVNPNTGTFTHANLPTNSYHLALDPSGTKFYTSTFEGPLITMPLTPFGGSGVATAVTGGDTGVTQVAFASNGAAYYVDGNPNCCGNVGTINVGTGVTTRLFTGVTPAHGIINDSFTGDITLFGGGWVGTVDPTGNTLKTANINGANFDQGAVDGFGHALVAGGNGITFIDYSTSHDITNPDKIIFVGGFNGIDDVAPLSGAGSNPNPVPEPSTMVLFGTALLGLALVGKKFVL